MGDHQRYDLATEEKGKFARVQCKTGHLVNGTVTFWCCSVDSRSQKGRCLRKAYRKDIEFFGVYCPENQKVYMVPVADATSTQCCLRIEPPKNGQKKGIRWAKTCEVSKWRIGGSNP